MLCSQKVKNETWHDWQTSRQKCFLKKEEEIEMTNPRSDVFQKMAVFNKERINEMNSVHEHFLSCKIMHCITFTFCIEHMPSSHLK